MNNMLFARSENGGFKSKWSKLNTFCKYPLKIEQRPFKRYPQ